MNSPDESILSAYLDGELGPRQARIVERALAVDPRLAARVEGLRSVRSLVAGLSRPSAPDLSTQVLARLDSRPPYSRPWFRDRRLTVALAGSLAAATILWFSLARFPIPRTVAPAPGHVAPAASPELAAHERDSSDRDEPRAGQALASTTDGRLPAGPIGPQRDAPGSSGHSAAVAENDATDAVRVRRLLDDPGLRRVFLVTDRIDQTLEPEVSSLVERTTHYDFFKITVAQGIVLDPEHPGHATVFAVVLDPAELKPFRDRLHAQFANRVQESDVSPAIPLQLAEIGQVVAMPPHPAGDVTIPDPEKLAIREKATNLRGPDEAENLAGRPTTPPGFEERQRSRPGTGSELATGSLVHGNSGAVVTAVGKTGVENTEAESSHPPGIGPPDSRLVRGPAPLAGNGPTNGAPSDHPTSARGEERCVVLVWLTSLGSS